MKITWFGHAAFLVEGVNPAGEAVRIILDPYNYPACGGYLPINEAADIVSISHHNERYHSDLSAIEGDYELIDALEHAGNSLTMLNPAIFVKFGLFFAVEFNSLNTAIPLAFTQVLNDGIGGAWITIPAHTNSSDTH